MGGFNTLNVVMVLLLPLRSLGLTALRSGAAGHLHKANELALMKLTGLQQVAPAGELAEGMTVTIIANVKRFEELCDAAGVMAMLDPGAKGIVKEIEKNDGTLKLESGGDTAWVPIKALVGFENWPKASPLPAPPVAQKVAEPVGPPVPPGPTDWVSNGCSRILAELDSYVAENAFTARDGMTLNKCFSHCKDKASMKYFAVTRGHVCFCTPIPPGVHISNSECDKKCADDARQSCGGVAQAASVYTMIDCAAASEQELKQAAEDDRAALLKEYASLGGTCGHAKDNLCEIKGSSKLPGEVAECKAACSQGEGAKCCHGFTYDDVKSECTFYQDVLAGSRTQKNGSRCYFKKLGKAKPQALKKIPLH